MRSSPNVVGDALKTPDAPRQIGDVAQHVQTQLTSTVDVKAAHQWVQPSGGEMHLPNVGFGGAESASLHAAIVPGGEQHAMAAAQQVGNQAISPIIQMIMKMPGHIGLVSSFFEALSSFFAPVQDLIGGLDASFLTAHIDAAASTLHSAGEHLGIDISLIPDDAPIFSMDDGGGGFAELLPKDGSTALSGSELKFNASEVGDSTGNAMNTSGYSDGGAQFEQVPNGLEAATSHVRDGIVTPQYLAMDNGQAIFRPTMGGFNGMSNSAIQVPSNVTPQQPTVIHPLTHQIAPHHPVGGGDLAKDGVINRLPEHAPPAIEQHAPALEQHAQHAAQPANDAAADRGTLLGHPHTRVEHVVDQVTADPQAPEAGQPAGDQVADTTQAAPEQGAEATTTYTIKPGDNLWDIAQHHFGDGLKWQEIYQLNHDVIGGDPTLIHPGTEIQLPGGGQELASNYTVQPGDNLWDISKAHLGGGQHWGELFHNNSDVIGSNPNLIHPGQHLDMNGGANHSQLASANADPASPAHHSASHAASHVAHHSAPHTPHTHQVAHNAPAGDAQTHHVAHHGAADHTRVAAANPGHAETQQVAAGSQQVPEALAATPSGQPVGLHASAPMGSLETTAQNLPGK